MRKTLNVRCCCTPGLVLGRLPTFDDAFVGRVIRSDAASVRDAPSSIAEPVDTIHIRLQVQTAHVVTRDRVMPERAYNSNHASVDDLMQIPGFELICNVPGA